MRAGQGLKTGQRDTKGKLKLSIKKKVKIVAKSGHMKRNVQLRGVVKDILLTKLSLKVNVSC